MIEATYDGCGYGYFGFMGRSQLAHRVAWMLFVGPIPDGLLVCHHCDVGLCVAPHHLFLGTHQDNADDMVSKGRGKPPRGVKHRSAKLDEDMVRAIRISDEPQSVVAARYGVTRSIISLVRSRHIWRHVE